jgi:hypothetical protein
MVEFAMVELIMVLMLDDVVLGNGVDGSLLMASATTFSRPGV